MTKTQFLHELSAIATIYQRVKNRKGKSVERLREYAILMSIRLLDVAILNLPDGELIDSNEK